MPFPLQAVGGKVVVPGSITYNSAGSNNFIVPEYDFIRVRMVGSSGGSAGVHIDNGDVYFAGGHGGDTSFNGVQVTGGGGAPNLSGGSGRAVASGGSVNTNGTNGPNGNQVNGGGGFIPLPVPAGVAAQGGGGAGAAGVASDTTNVSGAQGTAPGGGPRGERAAGSFQGGDKSTHRITCVTGGGQGGGYSEKTWASADAGAPVAQATLAAVVGAGGGAGANGGAAGQPGRIIIDWW